MKKITFARIIQRLISRFKLVRSADEEFQLSETIVPITSADDLISQPDIAQLTAIDVSSTGNKTGLTVPVGKRWKVSAIEVKSTSGTWTASSLSINDGTHSMKVYAPASSASTLIFSFGAPTTFDTGWTVTFYVDAVSVNGAATCSALVVEEDAY